ncbi:MAG TPA: diversity-generating retroelement protein Avd [Flavilitoribacter sp.]|nr:diversity-generating retroelement protein Avd [Flavilitoribacter sp.]HMQ86731.1 diversity-generating retroelement protein Avd [Flavilitoribacter sp.]
MAKASEYPLYEHWYKTLNWILDRCDGMPKHTRFTVSGRIAQLSVEVAEWITDAIYTRDRQPILSAVNKNLEKLRLYFRLCKDRHYISIHQYEFISKEINQAGVMCGGWMKNTKNHAQD